MSRVRTITISLDLDGDAFLREYRRQTWRPSGEMQRLTESMRMLARAIGGQLAPALQDLVRVLTEVEEFVNERWEAGCV